MKKVRVSAFMLVCMACCVMAQNAFSQGSRSEKLNFKKMEQVTNETRRIMDQFNDAFQKHDPSFLNGLIADDCVMESIQGPGGIRYEGYSSCYDFWSSLATDPNTHFDVEEVFVYGHRATIKWRYHWGKDKDSAVRGVNLMKVKDGKIIEALGYAKTVPNTGLDPQN